MLLGIIPIVGILAVFKYFNFFIPQESMALKLTMPLGISYYSFKMISFVMDSYNGKIEERVQWTDYAKNALSENKKLLQKFMSKNIPVFGYYYSHWIREIPQLKDYKLFYKSHARFKNHKIKELNQFLQEVL